MKLGRREALCAAAGVALAPALPQLAIARDYPTRAVKMVTGFAPGANGSSSQDLGEESP
jgi:tripartite-type tricarboxylate transporter receptor subunit TctC